jgi:hypothetical protein
MRLPTVDLWATSYHSFFVTNIKEAGGMGHDRLTEKKLASRKNVRACARILQGESPAGVRGAITSGCQLP